MTGAGEGRARVAVVIATYNRPTMLPDCAASIVADLAPHDEFVVSEGGDSHARSAVAKLSRPASVITVDDGGKSRRINGGVAVTTAPILVFTDDDCLVAPGWVEGMVAPFADPTVGVAFGPVRGLSQLPGEEGAGPPVGEAPFVTWTYAHGSSVAVRRDALLAIGGLDERLGPGSPAGAGEDHDLVLRLRERGWRAVIAAAPPVEHMDWRDPEQDASNQLVYERGAGAFLGAALRRGLGHGWPLLKHRLGYARQLVADRTGPDRRYALRALREFAGGLVYGLRLRPWKGPSG